VTLRSANSARVFSHWASRTFAAARSREYARPTRRFSSCVACGASPRRTTPFRSSWARPRRTRSAADRPVSERQGRAAVPLRFEARTVPYRRAYGAARWNNALARGKKLAESLPSAARLVRLLPVLGHLRAFQFGRRFEPPLREVLEHGFQMRVAGPFGQFSTPPRALSALLRVHAYRPTRRVLCAGPGQGIQGSSKPRPGGLGGSLSPGPIRRAARPPCAVWQLLKGYFLGGSLVPKGQPDCRTPRPPMVLQFFGRRNGGTEVSLYQPSIRGRGDCVIEPRQVPLEALAGFLRARLIKSPPAHVGGERRRRWDFVGLSVLVGRAALGNLLRAPNWLLGSGFSRIRRGLRCHDRIGNCLWDINGF
jgi:hypothetical protein